MKSGLITKNTWLLLFTSSSASSASSACSQEAEEAEEAEEVKNYFLKFQTLLTKDTIQRLPATYMKLLQRSLRNIKAY